MKQYFLKFTDKEEAIVYAIGHSGLAIFMTSITTAGGLLSFSTADLAPIADIGRFASIGVMISLVYTIVLLPALLALVPIKARNTKEERDKRTATLMDRFLTGIGNLSTGHPYIILVIGAIIIILSVALASKIRFSHHVLGWFPEKNYIRMGTERIDDIPSFFASSGYCVRESFVAS